MNPDLIESPRVHSISQQYVVQLLSCHLHFHRIFQWQMLLWFHPLHRTKPVDLIRYFNSFSLNERTENLESTCSINCISSRESNSFVKWTTRRWQTSTMWWLVIWIRLFCRTKFYSSRLPILRFELNIVITKIIIEWLNSFVNVSNIDRICPLLNYFSDISFKSYAFIWESLRQQE